MVLTAARDAAQRAAEIDANGYLGKPFEMAELLTLVSHHAHPSELSAMRTSGTAGSGDSAVGPGRREPARRQRMNHSSSRAHAWSAFSICWAVSAPTELSKLAGARDWSELARGLRPWGLWDVIYLTASRGRRSV